MTRTLALLCALTVAALAFDAEAKPKRPDGGACDSTGEERRDGTDQDGNKVNCLFDTCTFTECSTSGGQISNCVKKTTYSNPRDCKPAARTGTRLPGIFNRNTQMKMSQ